MKNHNKRIIDVILFISDRTKNENLEWVLTGSANLLIQGLSVDVEDIDILIAKKDVFNFYNFFKEFGIQKVEYSATDKFRSYFGKLIINEIKVEIMSRLEYKTPDNIWIKSTSLRKRKLIQFKNYTIPINPLENELKFYHLMKRKSDLHKIELIEKAFVNMNNL